MLCRACCTATGAIRNLVCNVIHIMIAVIFSISELIFWAEIINNNKTWYRFTREHYCMFLRRPPCWTSTAQHAWYDTSHRRHDWLARRVVLVVTCRNVTWRNTWNLGVTSWRRRDHVTPVLRRFHWLPVHRRLQFKIACLAISQCWAKTQLRHLLLMTVSHLRRMFSAA